MKRLFLIGLFFNLALLIIGLTWIAPIEARQDRAEFASFAARSVAPGSVAPGSVAPGSVAPGSVAPGSAAPASVVAGGPMTVALNQWSITPQALQAPAGPVTFKVSNDGTMPHEFVVIQTDTPAADFHIGSFEGEKFRVNENKVGKNVGETGDLRAGTTKTITIDLKPGHYVFMCNLPGHYGLGMHTDFTAT